MVQLSQGSGLLDHLRSLWQPAIGQQKRRQIASFRDGESAELQTAEVVLQSGHRQGRALFVTRLERLAEFSAAVAEDNAEAPFLFRGKP